MQIAAALQAEKLILMTDVPGVLRDKADVSTKFAELSIRQTRNLVKDGVIAGGMIPKCGRPVNSLPMFHHSLLLGVTQSIRGVSPHEAALVSRFEYQQFH